MSASHNPNPIAASVAATSTTSQLDFDNIMELLQNGLIDFMSCFSQNSERADKFKADFTVDLIISNVNKRMFNQHGRLMIKAAYPGIFKLSLEDQATLQKMVIKPPQSMEASVDHFFKRELIDAFVRSEVKKEYQPEMMNLVKAVYQFIVTANFSVEYEQILLKLDKSNKPIADKDRKFGIQATIISPIDLQVTEAINGVKLSTDALIA